MKQWAARLSQSRAVSIAGKTELLPLPRPIRDAISLEYHLQLEALRAGAGTLTGLRILMRVAMAAAILYERGYGGEPVYPFDEYERIANNAYAVGQEGRYLFDLLAFRTFAALVTDHDTQLKFAPVAVIDLVARRLQLHNIAA
jgi:hypothetical protein